MPNDKLHIHEEIFSLVYYGNGFTHQDIYTMPIYIRKFYIKKLLDLKQEEKKQVESIQKTSKQKIARPTFKQRFNK